MNRYLLITVLAATCPAAEKPASDNDPLSKQIVEEQKTERVAFPAGGVLRLKNPVADVTIEAWDESSVEITSIKTSFDYLFPSRQNAMKAQMGRVTVKAERQGNEVVITSDMPRHMLRGFGKGPGFLDGMRFGLEYHISVPRNARLVIDRGAGNFSVDGVTGDIEAKVRHGQIMLHLPEDAKYSIDAKSTYGNVNSDFPGQHHRVWIGQKAFADEPGPAHKLKLKIGYGDIVLLRIRMPKYPDAAPDKPGGKGL